MSANESEPVYLVPEQLCIGLYVHLDLAWSEHPFTFSSFRIKNQDQIDTIKSLGLTRIRYSPGRSEQAPLPLSPAPEPVVSPVSDAQAAGEDPQARSLAVPVPAIESQVPVPLVRWDQLAQFHEQLAQCEQQLIQAARTVRALRRELLAKPLESRARAEQLVGCMADEMLAAKDVSIHLMADLSGAEQLYDHGLNVALMSMLLARELKASRDTILAVGEAGLFHDIGEMELPDHVVRKKDPLTQAERKLMQTHCRLGASLAERIGLSSEVVQVIAQHHERVDGSGYPAQLKGPQVSLLSRIVAVVNAYDELCNPVDPTKALTPHEALSLLYGQQREAFDPGVMAAFVRCTGVYPPGTIVQLGDGRVGMVVSVHSAKPLKPMVLIHDPAVPRHQAVVIDLAHATEVFVSKALRPLHLSPEARDYLQPRKRMTCYFSADHHPDSLT
jgi:putative nucleotidyltransferase with HDIG domain